MRRWRTTVPAIAPGVLGLAALALAGASAGERPSPDWQPGAVTPQAADAADAAAEAAVPAADPVARWRAYSEEASRRFGVPLAWIERVIRAESGGRTTFAGRPIASPAGAMGLMQLMPATWAEMRASYALGADPFDPRDNILAGTAYLAAMYRRFGYPGLFGAYNAGPARYAAWLAGRGALPAETRFYLARLAGATAPPASFIGGAGTVDKGRKEVAIAAGDPSARERLFAVDRTAAATAAPAATPLGEGADRPSNGLFVALANAPSSASGD